ncbi:hypothetical protein HanIR_Chr02g0058401 [Helianthus annuus]|nr:hypothetical protein HanIR_Chr02g0058401 [Helianthus annuus]
MTRSMVMMLMIWLLRPNIRRSVVLLELTFRKVLLWNVKTTNFSWQVLSLCSMILMIRSLISFSHLYLKWKTLRRRHISKMIWIKKTEPQGKASVVCDENLSLKDDPKGKTNVVVDENLSLKDKSKFEMDLDKFLIPKNESHEKQMFFFLNRVCPP